MFTLRSVVLNTVWSALSTFAYIVLSLNTQTNVAEFTGILIGLFSLAAFFLLKASFKRAFQPSCIHTYVVLCNVHQFSHICSLPIGNTSKVLSFVRWWWMRVGIPEKGFSPLYGWLLHVASWLLAVTNNIIFHVFALNAGLKSLLESSFVYVVLRFKMLCNLPCICWHNTVLRWCPI